MKSVYLYQPKDIRIKEDHKIKKNSGGVRIKVKSAGICGSDIGAYKGVNPTTKYPLVIGHEIAGRVLEIEENPKGIHVGDKVVVDPYIYCGRCYPCSIGRTNNCENLRVIGCHTDGGMCEEIFHPIDLVHKIPEHLPYKKGAMVEPLAVALHSINMIDVKEGEHVVICGAGTIGLLIAACVLRKKAVPIVLDPIEKKLDVAKTMDVSRVINTLNQDVGRMIFSITKGRMAECLIEASGASQSIANMHRYVSYSGRIAIVGIPKGEIPLRVDRFLRKELFITGVRNSVGVFPKAVELISNDEIDVQSLITHEVSIERVKAVMEQLVDRPRDFLKVLVKL